MRTSTGRAKAEQTPLDRRFWRVAVLSIAITACGTLPVSLVGGVAVQIRDELGLPVSFIGILTAVFFFSSSAFSSSAGRITEGVGAGLAMRSAGLVAAIALFGIGLSGSAPFLIAFLVAGGLASALGQVGANLYLARTVDSSRQAFAFGIKQAGIPAATLFGGLAVPLIALTIGWRWAFAIGALLTLVVVWLVPGARFRGTGRRWTGSAAPEAPMLALVVLSVGGAFGAGAANSLGAFLVDSSVAAGVAEGSAGILFAIGSAAGLAGRAGMGWLADRATGGRLLWVAGLQFCGTLAFLLMATRDVAVLLPATLLGFAGGWGWPGLFNFAVVNRNPAAPAAATGVTQTGVYFGGMAGPLLFGFVAQHWGYGSAWLLAAGLSMTAAILVLIARHILVTSSD